MVLGTAFVLKNITKVELVEVEPLQRNFKYL